MTDNTMIKKKGTNKQKAKIKQTKKQKTIIYEIQYMILKVEQYKAHTIPGMTLPSFHTS
jgi:hypothetical protein